MSAAPKQLNGSSPWSQRYAAELRRVFHEQAAWAPRSLQDHLGPSELGVECDRQVVGKMAAIPATNHVTDPWPSIRGTALHTYAAGAFEADNERQGRLRWLAESRVFPHPDHPGTADLYDGDELVVVDHKFLGESSMAKVRSDKGPSRKYRVQLKMYGRGYRLMGFPVRRIALAAYPATASSLDGLYVWDEEWTSADDVLLDDVLAQTAQRKAMAQMLTSGLVTLDQIPMTPDSDECYFCDFYRPQSARDGGVGCPGAAVNATQPTLSKGATQ